MKPKEFIKNAMRTESKEYRFTNTGKVTPRIEHAVMGIVTEAGELMDAIKKAKIYGKELDKVNLIEELGDLMWYMALVSDELKVTFEAIWDKNIRKLKSRYPEKYTDNNALNRTIDREREELEK